VLSIRICLLNQKRLELYTLVFQKIFFIFWCSINHFNRINVAIILLLFGILFPFPSISNSLGTTKIQLPIDFFFIEKLIYCLKHSVADPVCLSQISDPAFSCHPGSHIKKRGAKYTGLILARSDDYFIKRSYKI
jgi:hypothetical protein